LPVGSGINRVWSAIGGESIVHDHRLDYTGGFK